MSQAMVTALPQPAEALALLGGQLPNVMDDLNRLSRMTAGVPRDITERLELLTTELEGIQREVRSRVAYSFARAA